MSITKCKNIKIAIFVNVQSSDYISLQLTAFIAKTRHTPVFLRNYRDMELHYELRELMSAFVKITFVKKKLVTSSVTFVLS